MDSVAICKLLTQVHHLAEIRAIFGTASNEQMSLWMPRSNLLKGRDQTVGILLQTMTGQAQEHIFISDTPPCAGTLAIAGSPPGIIDGGRTIVYNYEFEIAEGLSRMLSIA